MWTLSWKNAGGLVAESGYKFCKEGKYANTCRSLTLRGLCHKQIVVDSLASL